MNLSIYMSPSDDDSADIPETASTRQVEKAAGSHTFKIMGYSLEMEIGKGNHLESTTFNVGGYDWSIQYYPNGTPMAEDDQISIFLALKSKAKEVKTQASFIILNKNGFPLSANRAFKVATLNNDKRPDWGFTNFAKRSTFESILKDDCLVIKCTVHVFKVLPVEPLSPYHVPPPDVQHLSHLLEAGYGMDVTFNVNGQIFNAHKCILAASSQVFRAQFFGPLKEKADAIIKIEDMEAPVFKSLLHFIYTQTVPDFQEINGSEKKHNSKLMAQHLLVAADRYGLEKLKIICESILYSSVDRSNVVTLLSLSEMHNCFHLKRACMKVLASPQILDEVLTTEQLKVGR
ncbi:BTB/POZ and MATH domain-containing protein 2 [Rhynchospora pubera]|uniref:BTB/POZ and MATH domain-containing protein 2 n=2 Tax=Rhynchospora pubera TaxID=906938 RepID=A0AAV8GU78_9POAL|nr:BTB/POZ and MATH domain-containing protein 2 [Rhynchospora pubera]